MCGEAGEYSGPARAPLDLPQATLPTGGQDEGSAYRGVLMYKRILVPVDGSETSTKALVAALQLARESEGRIRLVHAMDELAYLTGFEYSSDLLQQARKYAQQLLADDLAMAQSAGVPADMRLVDMPGRRLGDVMAEEAANFEADLIVVGTHGRRGIGRALLGSGAEQVIRLAPVPVLVVRGGEQHQRR
jgi:nucleotide-binding universal stress UspA family protein